jgi:uncharacterized protein YigA (DUF484 family)
MTAKKNNLNEQSLVRDYLSRNPDFFEQNPDIFEVLNISHNSGKATSLVERQIGLMRDRNKDLAAQIDQMQTTAQDNALLMKKTNRLVLNLVQAKDLTQLIKALSFSLKNDFSTEFFSLTLFKDDTIVAKTTANFVSKDEAKSIINDILTAQKAVYGVRKEEELSLLFGNQAKDIGSILALPLKNSVTFGVLAFGHRDPSYYSQEIGTVFIDYIGDLLNELISKYLIYNN